MTLGILGERLTDLGYEATPALDDVRRALGCVDHEPELAFKLVSAVVATARRAHEPGARGVANMVRARLLVERGDYHAAMAAAREASMDLRLAGLATECIRADVAAARVLRELGDLDRAESLGADILERLNEERVATQQPLGSLDALVQIEYGRTMLSRSRHDAALTALDEGWNRARSLGDELLEARAGRGRAEAYLGLGMVHRALDEVDRPRRIFESLHLPAEAARCRLVEAACLVQLERAAEAVRLLETVRPAFDDRQAVVDRAHLANALGGALLGAGLVHDALAELQEAAEAYVDLGRFDDAARAHLQAASAHLVGFDRDRCLEQVDLAERLLRTTTARTLVVAPVLLRGAVARRMRDDEEAAMHGREALRLIDAAGEELSLGYRVHALLLVAHDPFDAATAQQHLEEARRVITQAGLEDIRLSLAVTEVRRLRQVGELQAAVQVLRDAVARATASLRADLVDEATAAGRLIEGFVYEELICVLLEIDTPSSVAEAWRWSGISRLAGSEDYHAAITRHRAVERPRAAVLPGVEVTDEIRALSDELDHLLERPESADPETFRRVRTDARRLLRRSFPVGAPAVPLATPAPDDAVPEGPLLQWHVFGADIAAFVVREGQVYGRTLRGAARDCRRLMAEWWIEVSRHAASVEVDHVLDLTQQQAMVLHRLSALVLAPIADLLVDLPVGAPLTVVGHGPLEEVPLEALELDGEALADRFELLFAVGIDPALLADRRGAGRPSLPARSIDDRPLVVLAVPDDAAPSIAREADEIRRLRPDATVLVGPEASTQALVDLDRSGVLLHLACHGVFDADHPRGSALRLGDRWMPAGEIATLDLTDAIVVMNACATGRLSKAGNDVGGLVWSLLAAGAAGVVATTWPINDVVATEFAVAFHRHLVEGALPAEAVAAARRDVRETHPHPWHWAAFRFTSAADVVLAAG